MSVSAQSVIAALLTRRPGADRKRLHGLLYFCQGHHLADLDEPLFSEALNATSAGVLVEDIDPADSVEQLTNGQLNTVGYVVSRYGNLSAEDLSVLIRSADPWRLASHRAQELDVPRIELPWLRDWFRRAGDRADNRISRDQLAKMAAGAQDRREGAGTRDTAESIQARIDAARDRLPSAP